MCGIAGILNVDGSPCTSSQIQRITDVLSHRGPDAGGVYTQGNIALGHRRLAILDLSEAGKQPMSVLDGRYWITFNGEVYNFLEIRQQLRNFGHQFHTDTDTEVIAIAYHQWGADCVEKFNGMWAFAIWDANERQLFLSRDRFGIKPLHYLLEPRRFVFASELKSFLRLEGFTARENKDELRRGLTRGESEEETLLEGVKLLRPGHNMMVSASGNRIWRWWRTLDHLTEVARGFSDQAQEFRGLFFDACRLRLRSDVPVATCLSGGMDSSSILCSVANLAGPNSTRGGSERFTRDFHRAYVATFEGTAQDEREFAEAAIAKAGADGRYRAMKSDNLVPDLTQYAYDFEMVGSALLLPIWAIYRELRREGVVVSLDGHGGDELLAGYEDSLRSLLRAEGSLLRAPLRTLDLVRTIGAMEETDQGSSRRLLRLLLEGDPFLRRVRDARLRIRRGTKTVSAKKRNPIWITGALPAGDAVDRDEQSAVEQLSPMNRQLYWMFHHGVLQSILRKYDRLSMAHGVEVRMPFMDWRLVCYAFSLPDPSKVGGGYTKRVLREAMRGVLPEKVRRRKSKLGFLSPIEDWLNHGLAEWSWERANHKPFLESDLWDGPAIRDFIAPRYQARSWSRPDALRVWKYLQADLWRETFFARTAEFRHSVA